MYSIHQGPDQLYPATDFITWMPDQAVKLRADDRDIISDPPISVVTALKRVAQEYPHRIAIVDSYNDVEDVYTYKRYYESVNHVAKAFIKLGLETANGVGLIGYNEPHLHISYMAAIFAGGIAACLNTNYSDQSLQYLIECVECNIVVVDDDTQLQRILQISDKLPHLKAIIQYRGKPVDGAKNVYSWDDIMQMNLDDYEEELKMRIMNIAPNKCCTILPTSGTTGQPKWVMLSHDNLIWDAKAYLNLVNEGETFPPDVVVSHLSFNQVSSLIMYIYWPMMCKGGTVHIAKSENQKSLVHTLQEVKPTVIFAVPKLWEMFMDYLVKDEISNKIKDRSITWAINEDKETNMILSSCSTILNLTKNPVEKKMATKLGLEKCRYSTVGGASSKIRVLEFFVSNGIPMLESYGMTECGLVTSNSKSNFKVGSVGRFIQGIQTKLKKDSESGYDQMYVSGRNLFMGYLKQEAKTKESFDEELFFNTVDLVTLDEDQYLRSEGRCIDLIIRNDAKKILPLPIERKILFQMPCLSHCVIVGDGRDFINVLLTFKTKVNSENGEPTDYLDDTALEWCRNIGLSAEKLSDIVNCKDPRLSEEIQKVIERTNECAAAEKELIQKWKILPRSFSVKGGELGLSMKLKRQAVYNLYKKKIDEFYE